MKLLKLQIRSFGKFKDQTFTFDEGFNAFCEANEFGKTTLIYFIYYMFYGYEPKRLKTYLPWSGEELAGSLEFSLEGRRWRIERRRPHKGMEKKQILCVETGEELTLANKEQPGVRFLGLDGETFLRSFCITQGDLLFSHTEGLDVALKNMAATGEENVSFAQAADYLNKQHTLYMHHGRNRGNLVDWEDALARGREEEQMLRRAVDARISERRALEDLDRALAQKEQEILALAERVRAAEGSDALKLLERLDALKKLPRAEKPAVEKETLATMDRAFQAQEEARAAHQAAEQQAAAAREALYATDRTLRSYGFHNESEREVRLAGQRNGMLPLLLIIAGLPINLGGILLEQWWINLGAVLLMAVGIALMAGKAAKRKEICRRYGVADGTALAGKWAEYQTLLAQRAQAEATFEEWNAKVMQKKEAADAAAEQAEQLRRKFRLFSRDEVREQQIAWGVYERASSGQSMELQEQALLGGRTRRALEALAEGASLQEETAEQARAELRRAEQARESLRAEREGMDHRDLQNLWEQLEKVLAENAALEQKIAEGKAALAAVLKALDWLRSANEEMNTYFAPKLCKEAGKYLSVLTAGKYDTVLMDREYAIRLESAEGTYPAEDFSEGTKDAVYFAFRLAAADMLGEEPLPMILDDPFTNLDDTRRARAKDLLAAAAAGRQILYFTCRAEG